MNLFDIIKSTCDHIKAVFPAAQIHISQLPQGFERPAFYVSLIGFDDKDLCKNGLQRKLTLSIVYFPPQDARGLVNPAQRYEAFQKLLAIFQHQCLKVNERFLKITSIDGGPRDSEVYLDIGIKYSFTPGSEPEYELMQKLITAYK